jgi:hypothetical protein
MMAARQTCNNKKPGIWEIGLRRGQASGGTGAMH